MQFDFDAKWPHDNAIHVAGKKLPAIATSAISYTST